MSDIKEVHSKLKLYVTVNLFWSMAAMLRDSVVAIVVRTRPRAIPLAMITMRKSTLGFPFLSHDEYGAPLGGPSGRRSSANNLLPSCQSGFLVGELLAPLKRPSPFFWMKSVEIWIMVFSLGWSSLT